MSKNPLIINANISFDDRGEILHCNSFDFQKYKIKRFYEIKNHNINFIRAWHGHKLEKKYILILQGSLKICLIKIDNWKNPSKKKRIFNYFLNEKKPQVLYVPGGYAHGTQNLTKDTRFMVFSTFSVKESIKDDYRFDHNYWNNWKTNYR
jgi:dTDP-4-dehydrorhamnose 3,5-epimerase-like enzyme